jgi:hypothetical protein
MRLHEILTEGRKKKSKRSKADDSLHTIDDDKEKAIKPKHLKRRKLSRIYKRKD